MAKERKFSEIIERVEYVRRRLSMNKSRFSTSIGMTPQTYNNFIGAQGSKPSIEDVRDHMDQIRDLDGYTVPESIADELKATMAALQ